MAGSILLPPQFKANGARTSSRFTALFLPVAVAVACLLVALLAVGAAAAPRQIISDPDVEPSGQWIVASGTGADQAHDVAVAPSGVAYVCGTQTSTSHGLDATLTKMTASGAVWSRTWDGTAHRHDIVADVAVGPGGVVYTAGSTQKAGGSTDMLVIKWSASGHALWSRRYGGPVTGDDLTKDVVVDAHGNVIVGGRIRTGAGYAFTVVSWTPQGVRRWAYRSRAGDGRGMCNALLPDGSGNVYAAGNISDAGIGGAHIVKLSPTGKVRWSRTRLGGDWGAYEDIAPRRGGGVFVCGSLYDGVEGGSAGLVTRFTASGQAKYFDWPPFDSVSFNAIAVTPTGTVCAGGREALDEENGRLCRVLYDGVTGDVISAVAPPDGLSERVEDVAADAYGGLYFTFAHEHPGLHTSIATSRESTVAGGAAWLSDVGNDVVGLNRPAAIATWRTTVWVVGVAAVAGGDQIVLRYVY